LTSRIQISSSSLEALRRTDELALAGRLALELMHEINNPLDALGSLAYLALEESDEAEGVRTYLIQIQEQVTTLRRIVAPDAWLGKIFPHPEKREA